MGQAYRSPEEEEVKDLAGRSTTAKSNGQPVKNTSKAQSRGKSFGMSLRRLTKRQKDKIRRIVTMVILVIFGISIVGAGVFSIMAKAPVTGH